MVTVDVKHIDVGLVLAEDLVKDKEVIVPKNKVLEFEDIDKIQRNFTECKIYSLRELEPYILSNCAVSDMYISFLVNNFNLVFSSVFNNIDEFKGLANYISNELTGNREAVYSLLCLRQNHKYTYEHSTNVALLCLEVAYALDLTDSELHKLVFGAILHDLGKLKISNDILDKPDKLTDSEFEIIKKHPYLGTRIADTLDGVDSSITTIINQHHEKLDGTGYPDKRIGHDINELSRIVTVCDIFDAITSRRSYHNAKSYEDCADILREDVKNNKLDSNVVNALISKTVLYPLDTYVKLSNGVSGFVVIEDRLFNRPTIFDVHNNKLYNLKDMPNVRIIYSV